MMLTIVLGVVVYSVVPWDTMTRVIQRIALLPIVLGVSFEFLKLTNAMRDMPVLRFSDIPVCGRSLLTTKEPTDDQVEVSIASFNRMRELDAQYENVTVHQSVTGSVLDPAKG